MQYHLLETGSLDHYSTWGRDVAHLSSLPLWVSWGRFPRQCHHSVECVYHSQSFLPSHISHTRLAYALSSCILSIAPSLFMVTCAAWRRFKKGHLNVSPQIGRHTSLPRSAPRRQTFLMIIKKFSWLICWRNTTFKFEWINSFVHKILGNNFKTLMIQKIYIFRKINLRKHLVYFNIFFPYLSVNYIGESNAIVSLGFKLRPFIILGFSVEALLELIEKVGLKSDAVTLCVCGCMWV